MDDIVVWAPDLPQLVDRVKTMNVALIRKKSEIRNEIAFAVLMVSSQGFKLDPNALYSRVRSFLGLTNQLSRFEPDFTRTGWA